MDELAEKFECCICNEIFHSPVLISPCQHVTCGGCLSDWVKKEKVCPTCREPIKTVFKSFYHKELVEMILSKKPELKRDTIKIGELNAINIFTDERYDFESPSGSPKKRVKKEKKPVPANDDALEEIKFGLLSEVDKEDKDNVMFDSSIKREEWRVFDKRIVVKPKQKQRNAAPKAYR